MTFPVDAARRHIEQLEQKHGIEVRLCSGPWDAEADSFAKMVWVPDPTTPLRYLVALHEFGHCVDKVSAKVMKGSKPEEEAAAWRWAVNEAIPALLEHMTPRQWTTVGKAWLTSVTPLAPGVG